MAMCKDTYAVRRWKASYYWQENKVKKWIYGDLLLTHEGLRCIIPKDDKIKESRDMDFILRFADITQLMKAKSMFIYDAIVIIIGTTQHWLSSLQNRDAVFNIVEHFWRDRLVSTKSSPSKSNGEKTKLGQELLKIAHDSDQTLQKGAEQLYRQGSQLDDAAELMYDLHSDLDVAENLVSGLESWVGRWSVPGLKYVPDPPEIIQRTDVADFVEIPVLFTSHKRPSDFLARRGLCRVSKEGITIMDEKQSLIQHYQPRNVSMLRIISPWEMIISKYMIGQPDVAYTLVSVQMLQILKALEPTYRRQIQYDNPPSEIDRELLAKRCEGLQRRSSKDKQDSPRHYRHSIADVDMNRHMPSKLQKQKQRASVSQAEVEEISDIMSRMKSMATDIGSEQDRQMERIDSLTQSVDRGNIRLKDHTFRINKLL